MSINGQSGFYGKMPCKGDFVSRGLSRGCVDNLDRWLQQGMTASRSALDERWTERYMVAPVWHFYISPGVLDSDGWLGIFIPSVDSVGRTFPCYLAIPVHSPFVSLKQLEDQHELMLEAEDLLLNILDHNFDFSLFCYQVSQLKAVPAFPSVDLYRSATPVQCMRNVDKQRAELRHLDIYSEYPRPTVWWTEGSETITPQLWLNDGLPDSSQFRYFLEGM